jgi:hypothetical protein
MAQARPLKLRNNLLLDNSRLQDLGSAALFVVGGASGCHSDQDRATAGCVHVKPLCPMTASW